MKRLIYIMIGLVGFTLLIGSAGAYEINNISGKQAFIQAFISAVIMAIACFGLDLEEKREANRWDLRNDLKRK